MTKPFQEFYRYCREHHTLGALLAMVIALVYAKQAFSMDFYVDAEVILNNPHTIYNWNQIGRFGLIGLKLLLGGNWYNPYLAAALFLVTLWLVGMGTAYLFSRMTGKLTTWIYLLFLSLFLVFPTYADQFMFRFQSFEIAFGMLLVIWATIYFYFSYKDKKRGAFLLAICMEIVSFGIYQSMVNLQICFYIAVYLFLMTSLDGKGRRWLIKEALIWFLTGFVIYEGIVQLFFSGGEYLTNQIGWFSGDLYMTVRNLLAYGKRMLLALDAFYPVTFFLCVCCGLVILVWCFLRQRKNFAAVLLGIGGMLASPFLLAFVTGTPTAYRAQCMLPFVCAVMWLYTVTVVRKYVKKKKQVFRTGCIVLGGICLFAQSSALLRMQYTQDVIRKADEIQAVQMMERIELVNEDHADKPVIFIGHLDAKINGSCYTKEQAASFLSYSVYEFAYVVGAPVATPDYFNTGRILGYFETLGFTYTMPTPEMVAAAQAEASNLPCWPALGSVQETENYMIVKLSEN